MERVCTRCVRVSLLLENNIGRVLPRISSRRFSATITVQAEDDSSISNKKSPAVNDVGTSIAGAMRRTQPNRPAGLLIRRTTSNGTPDRPQQAQPRGGSLNIRRTGSPEGGPVLRRTGTGSQPGLLIRRTGGPGTRGPGSPSSGTTGQGGQAQKGQQRRRRRPADRVSGMEDEADYPTETEMDEYMTKYLDRPANPTESITYNPTKQQATELQKDWPNTPLSSTGLTASLVQKIEWLARRIPHGYQTPEQLAEQFYKGNLTRFESAEEKALVLQIAQKLAKKKADRITESIGEEVAPRDMSMVDMTAKEEDKESLVGSVVNGNYSELEKQRMPFLDNIVRTLRNNETYSPEQASKFMAKIQSVMPSQGARRAAPRSKA